MLLSRSTDAARSSQDTHAMYRGPNASMGPAGGAGLAPSPPAAAATCAPLQLGPASASPFTGVLFLVLEEGSSTRPLLTLRLLTRRWRLISRAVGGGPSAPGGRVDCICWRWRSSAWRSATASLESSSPVTTYTSPGCTILISFLLRDAKAESSRCPPYVPGRACECEVMWSACGPKRSPVHTEQLTILAHRLDVLLERLLYVYEAGKAVR